MTVAATTLTGVREGVELVMRGLTPAATQNAEDRWVAYDRRSRPSARTRRYRVEFGATEPEPNGWMDTFIAQHRADLSVVADYAMPYPYIDEVIGEDAMQIEQAIYTHLVRGEAVTVGGSSVVPSIRLVGVEYVASTVTEQSDTGDTQRVSHDYVVHYMRDRGY